MRESIVDSVTSVVKDLNKSGLVDNVTMKNIEKLCLPEIGEYTPEKIVRIRKSYKLSQAALASVFNVSPSTVRQWEQGAKKPAGSAQKLLSLIEKKGVEVLI